MAGKTPGNALGPELARLPVDPEVKAALERAAVQAKRSVADLRRQLIYEGLDRLLGEGWRAKVKKL